MDHDKHDWEIIAQRDPIFGVLSNPNFRTDIMTGERRRDFYASGVGDIEGLLGRFDQYVGARPSSGRALDIGCGVGRLTMAIAKVMPAVTGSQVADPMLAIARCEAAAQCEVLDNTAAGTVRVDQFLHRVPAHLAR